MSTPLCMKRMTRERVTLNKPSNDYFVFFEDDNLRKLEAYVIGPEGTLYEHKFVKLRFQIPDQYPFCPPQCTFVQHSGGRIHPNLYVEGKVCLSILGTWAGEPWSFAMNIETVLITVRSLLDNHPYRHEPGQADHKPFNAYVQYTTWRTLLLDYLANERNPDARAFLRTYISTHAGRITQALAAQSTRDAHVTQFNSPYGTGRRGRGAGAIVQNYAGLVVDVNQAVELCVLAVEAEKQSLCQSQGLKQREIEDGRVREQQQQQQQEEEEEEQEQEEEKKEREGGEEVDAGEGTGQVVVLTSSPVLLPLSVTTTTTTTSSTTTGTNSLVKSTPMIERTIEVVDLT